MSTTEMKPWQRDYALDCLLDIEAIYHRHYNHRTSSPFEAVKKHIVAAELADGVLRVADDKSWAYALSTTKVTTKMALFQNITIGQRRPGDRVLSKIAASWTDSGWLREFHRLTETPSSLWIQVWANDVDAERELLKVAQRVGSKVSTFGDVFAWYLIARESSGLFEQDYIYAADRVVDVADQHYCAIAPLSVDVRASSAALAASLPSLSFANHYSNYNATDAWSALALRGYFPDPSRIEKPAEMNKKWHAKHGHEPSVLQDTVLRAQLPAVEAVLRAFPVEHDKWHRIRLMRLAPGGGELQRHTDQVDVDSGVGVGQLMRIHVPLITNPHVVFTVWNKNDAPINVNMPVGEAWMLDTRWPHRAINGGETERIHLVMDVVTTPTLLELLPRGR